MHACPTQCMQAPGHIPFRPKIRPPAQCMHARTCACMQAPGCIPYRPKIRPPAQCMHAPHNACKLLAAFLIGPRSGPPHLQAARLIHQLALEDVMHPCDRRALLLVLQRQCPRHPAAALRQLLLRTRAERVGLF